MNDEAAREPTWMMIHGIRSASQEENSKKKAAATKVSPINMLQGNILRPFIPSANPARFSHSLFLSLCIYSGFISSFGFEERTNKVSTSINHKSGGDNLVFSFVSGFWVEMKIYEIKIERIRHNYVVLSVFGRPNLRWAKWLHFIPWSIHHKRKLIFSGRISSDVETFRFPQRFSAIFHFASIQRKPFIYI